MTPMTRAIADAQKNWLVFSFSFFLKPLHSMHTTLLDYEHVVKDMDLSHELDYFLPQNF